MRRKDKLEWYSDPGLFTSSMLLLLVDDFTVECLQWDPVTIEMELRSKLRDRLSKATLDRAQAARMLAGNNLFHKSVEAFMACCCALNLRGSTPGSMAALDLESVYWGMAEARIIEGPEEFAAMGFTHNIKRYMGLMLSNEGALRPGGLLRMAEMPEAALLNADAVAIDDPVLSAAGTEGDVALYAELDGMVEQRMALLAEQVMALPLSASTDDFIKKLTDGRKQAVRAQNKDGGYGSVS